MTVTGFVFQPNTNTTCSPPRPTPFAVNVPETVKDVPCTGFAGDAEAVKEVETGFESVPVFMFNEIVPALDDVTIVGLLELVNVDRVEPTGPLLQLNSSNTVPVIRRRPPVSATTRDFRN
jgi:hypothetical protein